MLLSRDPNLDLDMQLEILTVKYNCAHIQCKYYWHPNRDINDMASQISAIIKEFSRCENKLPQGQPPRQFNIGVVLRKIKMLVLAS